MRGWCGRHCRFGSSDLLPTSGAMVFEGRLITRRLASLFRNWLVVVCGVDVCVAKWLGIGLRKG